MDKSSGQHRKSGCPIEVEMNNLLLFWKFSQQSDTLVGFVKILYPVAETVASL